MKIFLTGHNGFIGSHLHKHLCNKHEIITTEDNLLYCDLNYDVDLVIHLAALPGVVYSLKHPFHVLYNNIKSSYRIFKHFKCPIIYASSSTVYEPWRNPYALSKWIVEKIAPKHSMGLRFTTIYGEGGRQEMFMHKLKTKTLTYVVKDTFRDFLHINDLLSAFSIILDKNILFQGCKDIGSGSLVCLSSLAPDVKQVNKKWYDRSQNKADNEWLLNQGWNITRKLFDI